MSREERKPPQMTMNGDGTLSLSIEETNALRVSLGLKPLNSEVTETKISEKEIHKPAQKVTNVDDIKARIEKAKWLRKERELKRTKTLAESSEDDSEEEDAAAFVEKSRKLEKEKKLAKEKLKKMEQEEKEREENIDLNSITIAHNEEAFSENPIILTLADKDIMDEGEDELENINLKEEEKRIYNKKQEKKSFDYNVYDAIDNPSLNLLNQYDNETFEESKKKFKIKDLNKKEIEIGKSSTSSNINDKDDSNQMIYDLDDEKKFMSEYKTEKVKIKKRKIKEKKIRNIDETSSLISLNSNNDDTTTTTTVDHGSRRNRNSKETKEDEKMIEREIGYKIAMDKAELKSKILFKNLKQDGNEIDEKFEKQKLNEKLTKNQFKEFENITEKIKEISKEEEEIEKLNSKNSKFLNSTQEFVKSIKIEKAEKIEIKKSKIKREEKINEMEMEEEEEEEFKITIPQISSTSSSKSSSINKNDSIKRELEEDVFEEPLVSSGLAAALEFADQFLEKSNDKQPKTKKIKYSDEFEFDGVILPEIKIERKDRFGQVMNEKKSWKQMTQKFHNKMPGKNKLEKERRQFEQQQKIKQMSSTDTPLKSVETLQKIQKQSGQAYIEFGKTGSMKRKERPNE